jgi:hypothetical protein
MISRVGEGVSWIASSAGYSFLGFWPGARFDVKSTLGSSLDSLFIGINRLSSCVNEGRISPQEDKVEVLSERDDYYATLESAF